MIWQRKVRVVLALAGAVALFAVFYLARERQVAPTVSLQPTDRRIVTEGGATTTTRISGSIEEARWSYDRFEEYDDGSSWYSAMYLEFTSDEVEIWADEALLHAPAAAPNAPRQLDMTGNVRFLTSDGLELLTSTASYDEATGVVTMPDHVEFLKGRLTGEGLGARYDRRQDLFRLERDARVQVAPDEDGEFIDATSLAMTLARAEQFLRLESEARIVRAAEVLAADRATLYFVEETEELRHVDLAGRASVTAARDAVDPPPDMRGDNISLTFHPENRTLERATLVGNASLVSTSAAGQRTIVAPWIDVTTGDDGHTVTGLQANQGVTVRLPAGDDSPARTIRAPDLTASGTSQTGLQEARFEGGVVFTEHAAEGDTSAERTGESLVLVLQLDGDLESIDDAEFQDDVKFLSGETAADADLANYSEAQDLLVLHSVAGRTRRPHVEDGEVSIDAASITLGLGGDRVDATGNVRTHSEPDPAAGGPRQPGLLAADAPVIGSAPEIEYDGEAATMVYRGTETELARILQGESSIEGLHIELDDETGNLTATGSVTSTFVLEDDSGAPEAEAVPYETRADVLEYDEQTRVATYRGAPVHMSSGEGETEADVVVLTLSEGERRVREVEWTGSVYALFEKNYEASGNWLHYEAATGRYVLRGQPAITKFPSDDGSDCQKVTGQYTAFSRETGEGDWPESENRRVLTGQMDCGKSIR